MSLKLITLLYWTYLFLGNIILKNSHEEFHQNFSQKVKKKIEFRRNILMYLEFENVHNKSFKNFYQFCHSLNQPVLQYIKISAVPETGPFKVSHM